MPDAHRTSDVRVYTEFFLTRAMTFRWKSRDFLELAERAFRASERLELAKRAFRASKRLELAKPAFGALDCLELARGVSVIDLGFFGARATSF